MVAVGSKDEETMQEIHSSARNRICRGAACCALCMDIGMEDEDVMQDTHSSANGGICRGAACCAQPHAARFFFPAG